MVKAAAERAGSWISVATLGALCGAGCETQARGQHFEERLLPELRANGWGDVRVECPQRIALGVDTKFRCVAVFPEGPRVPLDVKLARSGELTWRANNKAMDRSGVGRRLAKATLARMRDKGLSVEVVNCPNGEPGQEEFPCTVRFERGDEFEAKVRFFSGVLQWKLNLDRIMDPRAMESAIAAGRKHETGQEVTVDCGGIRRPDGDAQWRCVLGDGQQVVVKPSGDAGTFVWHLE